MIIQDNIDNLIPSFAKDIKEEIISELIAGKTVDEKNEILVASNDSFCFYVNIKVQSYSVHVKSSNGIGYPALIQDALLETSSFRKRVEDYKIGDLLNNAQNYRKEIMSLRNEVNSLKKDVISLRKSRDSIQYYISNAELNLPCNDVKRFDSLEKYVKHIVFKNGLVSHFIALCLKELNI